MSTTFSDTDGISPGAWYSTSQKIVTNVISVLETKEAMGKTFELLKTFLEHVKANEPGVELFLLNRDDEHFQFVTYEIYKDEEAVKLHLGTKHMRELVEAEERYNVKRDGNEIHHETLVAQIGPRR
ncbi:hypothetical protein NW762_013814 [Fusarium torreyae]|uniref:ABM domain-containing protein n=1 Tax=Fusarium torreyae TaxID=1237075 RepID=A0A9W8RK34_9HYPO|nr:hypothetical protein NW762_013814 [Fusarium torreyae]